MSPTVLMILLALTLSAIGVVLIISGSNRDKRLNERIEAAIPAGPVIRAASQAAGIRLQAQEDHHWIKIGRILKVPIDLPLAHVVPPAWVFVVATLFALLAAWLGHFLTSWAIAVAESIVTWFVLVRSIFGWELSRYQLRLVRQLPDTIQLVVSATRAGLPVTESFRTIAREMPSPTRDEFARIEQEMILGVPPEDALLHLHQRTGVAEYAIFAVTIGVQARSGGRLAETIQNLAETVRERLTITARARSLAGEARVSAWIMGMLPVISGGLLSIIQPQHLSPLINDPRGVQMTIVGIVTLLLGIFSMQQLIRGATRD